MSAFTGQRVLGRSGLKVGPLGLAASYGAEAKAFGEAFAMGCNYFYWGSFRRDGMGDAMRTLGKSNRDKMVIALQSYARWSPVLRWSVLRGLRSLKTSYADVLLLGWYNHMPSERIMEQALRLKQEGHIRSIAISCHDRPMFQNFIRDKRFDIIMTRYNAAHRGAEREVFPHLDNMPANERPGVISYTATRWGWLIDAKNYPATIQTPTAADCYRFALSNPHVDLALTGPETLEQMRANLKALEKGPLSSEEMTWMKQAGDHIHRVSSKKLLTNPFMQRQQ